MTKSTQSRAFATLALGLFLGLGAFAGDVSAQAAKEPTDGFFDVPPRDPSEITPPWGLPAYLITSAMGGLSIFIVLQVGPAVLNPEFQGPGSNGVRYYKI